MAVFFVVRPVAIPVFEVDAEILHRFASQLLDHARPYGFREFATLYTQRRGERRRIRRILLERRQRQRPQLARGVGSKEVGTAINGVDRLPILGLAGPGPSRRGIDLAQVAKHWLQVSRRKRTSGTTR